ncbi:hypothetical protein CBS101457_003817 [Exobasidium rhododendri]|nr:hypothetical protein CBS101457_003817 [Exobasidium rhododendri]
MTSTVLPPALDGLMIRVTSKSVQDLPPLRPTKPFDASLTSPIDSYVQTIHGNKASVRAALHLLNDDVDRAHKIAQDDEGEMTSDLIHAILHRREGDYWNSKWWYRQINHPLISEVYGSTARAQTFVDEVESIVTNKKGASTACAAVNVEKLKQKQAEELAALVRFAIQGK